MKIVLPLLIFFCSTQLTAAADFEEGSAIYVPERIDDGGSWPLFFKSFGDDLFEVRFPIEPVVADEGKTISYMVVDSSTFPLAIYGMTFHKECIETDPIELFSRILEERSHSPTTLLWKKVTQTPDSYILDIISKTENLKVFRKERVIVISCNVYFLYTIFFPNTAENHDYFVSSFKTEY